MARTHLSSRDRSTLIPALPGVGVEPTTLRLQDVRPNRLSYPLTLSHHRDRVVKLWQWYVLQFVWAPWHLRGGVNSHRVGGKVGQGAIVGHARSKHMPFIANFYGITSPGRQCCVPVPSMSICWQQVYLTALVSLPSGITHTFATYTFPEERTITLSFTTP